jgi:hypothetical protein
MVYFNNKTYSSTFSYSYSERRFYAIHDIYVDKYSSSKTYYFTVKVQDNNFSKILFETSKSIYIDGYSYDNNLNWANMNVNYYYNYSGYNSNYNDCYYNNNYDSNYTNDGYDPNSGITYYDYYYGN